MKEPRFLENRKSLLALALLLCAALVVAVAISVRAPRSVPQTSLTSPPMPPQSSSQSQFLPETQPVRTSYVSNLGGFITAVGNGTIAISENIPGKSQPVATTVSVGSDTAIFKENFKDQATIQAQESAYRKQGAASSTPPLPYTPSALVFSDLKPGMLVIISLAPQNASNGLLHALTIGVLPL
jgi:hypothetical protein